MDSSVSLQENLWRGEDWAAEQGAGTRGPFAHRGGLSPGGEHRASKTESFSLRAPSQAEGQDHALGEERDGSEGSQEKRSKDRQIQTQAR